MIARILLEYHRGKRLIINLANRSHLVCSKISDDVLQGRSRPDLERLEFVNLGIEKVKSSREKRAFSFFSHLHLLPASFSLSLSLPILLSPSHSAAPHPRPSLSFTLAFSFSRRGKPSANVLDGRCSDGATQRNATRCSAAQRVARRCACVRTASLPSSLFSLVHRESNSPLHHAELLPCACYVIDTFTLLALSERDDAISRLFVFHLRVPELAPLLNFAIVKLHNFILIPLFNFIWKKRIWTEASTSCPLSFFKAHYSIEIMNNTSRISLS